MSIYNKALNVFEKNYLMYSMIVLLISSCMGGAAALLVLNVPSSELGVSEVIQLAILVAVCMWFNASILANQKPKLVFNSGVFSIVVSLLFIIAHILFL